jgi:hypothetical protein
VPQDQVAVADGVAIERIEGKIILTLYARGAPIVKYTLPTDTAKGLREQLNQALMGEQYGR